MTRLTLLKISMTPEWALETAGGARSVLCACDTIMPLAHSSASALTSGM
jgi:hypothetical protein